MRLKQYLNEEYNKRLIENTITYDLYCKILDSDEIDNIIENCINESEASDDAKKRGLEYIGFGRYVHKDNKDAVKAITAKSKIVLPGKEQTPQEPNMDEILKVVMENTKATIPSILVQQEADRLLSQMFDEIKNQSWVYIG